MGGGNLLGIAQQSSELDVAQVVAVRAVDREFLGVGYLFSGMDAPSLVQLIDQEEYNTSAEKMQKAAHADGVQHKGQ